MSTKLDKIADNVIKEEWTWIKVINPTMFEGYYITPTSHSELKLKLEESPLSHSITPSEARTLAEGEHCKNSKIALEVIGRVEKRQKEAQV